MKWAWTPFGVSGLDASHNAYSDWPASHRERWRRGMGVRRSEAGIWSCLGFGQDSSRSFERLEIQSTFSGQLETLASRNPFHQSPISAATPNHKPVELTESDSFPCFE